MTKKAQTKRGEVVIYKAAKGPELRVRLEKETVWLTQAQIGLLFGTQRPAITKHLKNIFKSGELKETSVGSILEQVATRETCFEIRFDISQVISKT